MLADEYLTTSAHTQFALTLYTQGCSEALVGLRDRTSSTTTATSISGTAAGGGFAVAPQEPWIQNATLKDNVLFGRPLDTARQGTPTNISMLY